MSLAGESIYLSIDLDYWMYHETDRGLWSFVNRALSLGVPTMAVQAHHWLLSHINKHPAHRLINVDFHDDIVFRDEEGCAMSDGTWVSYVKWRGKGQFEWRYPCRDSLVRGVCEPMGDVYNGSGSKTGWSRVTKKYGLRSIPWTDVLAVGIAVSADYLGLGSYWPGQNVKETLGQYHRILPKIFGRKVNLDEVYRLNLRQ